MKVVVALACGILLYGCSDMNHTCPVEHRIEIKPINIDHPIKRSADMHEGRELSGLVVLIKNDAMQGYAELRFPEVLHSSMGFHFLDNYARDIVPLNELDQFPQWRTDPTTSAVHYDCQLPEGLHFGAKLIPHADEVLLEFYVANHTNQTLDFVEVNPCFNFRHSPDFNASWNLRQIYAHYDSRFQSMDHTTPTKAEIGREPWLLFINQDYHDQVDLPRDSGTWWRVDQLATENLMAAQSRDGKRFIGYAWRESPKYMMSNCGYPCLHSGPNFIYDLPPGQRYDYRGKIYFHQGDAATLLDRYQKDRTIWNQQLKEINATP